MTTDSSELLLSPLCLSAFFSGCSCQVVIELCLFKAVAVDVALLLAEVVNVDVVLLFAEVVNVDIAFLVIEVVNTDVEPLNTIVLLIGVAVRLVVGFFCQSYCRRSPCCR